MHRHLLALLLAFAIVFGSVAPAHAYSLQYTDSSATKQIRWPTTTITVALSSSLSTQQPNIKSGSDVIGAVRRAMAHWSAASNIRFVETSSSAISISPNSSGGDGISLITVANTPENASAFPVCGSSPMITGRARVFYNPDTGGITESDIAINPCQQFSTDGTTNTYDLESTLTHEFGHFLGLEHSAVVGATMQPRQGLNGLYNLPTMTARTLSLDDNMGVRTIYGPRVGGGIEGTITFAGGTPAFGAHVWAEDVSTGRVAAGNISLPNGAYFINTGLGTFRLMAEYLNEPIAASEISSSGGAYGGLRTSQPPFRVVELGQFSVADATIIVPISLSSTPPSLNPRIFGINSQLSTIAVPLVAGNAYTVFVGGDGVDQVPGSGISVTSNVFTVDPASLQQYGTSFGTPYPIISFNVRVADNATAGDYSIRLQSNSGEVAYLVGALTIDPVNNTASANPIDDISFFVRQQYLDFLSREPDQIGLANYVQLLQQCPNGGYGENNPQCDRVKVSLSFFQSTEFQARGFFVYRFYQVGLGRRPTYAEFVTDRQRIGGAQSPEQEAAAKIAYTNDFVQRPEFANRFNQSQFQDPAAYVRELERIAGVTVSNEAQLISDLRTGAKTRAEVLRAIVETQEVFNKYYNQAFVALQYFGYLKRDPDQESFLRYVQLIDSTGDYRHLVFGFIYSTEYRSRFGTP